LYVLRCCRQLLDEVQLRAVMCPPKDKAVAADNGWEYSSKGSGQKIALTGVSVLTRVPVLMLITDLDVARGVLGACNVGNVVRLHSGCASVYNGLDGDRQYKVYSLRSMPIVVPRPCGLLPAAPLGSVMAGKAFEAVAGGVTQGGRSSKVCVLFSLREVIGVKEGGNRAQPHKLLGQVLGCELDVEVVLWGGVASAMAAAVDNITGSDTPLVIMGDLKKGEGRAACRSCIAVVSDVWCTWTMLPLCSMRHEYCSWHLQRTTCFTWAQPM
jgi:hypothetical protein